MSIQQAHEESTTTPPDSFTKQPLTPPPSDQKSTTVVEDILGEIKNRKSSRVSSASPWLRYSLDVSSCKNLDDLIEADWFVKDKLRCDYFHSADLLVLRMPSLLHETILSSIVEDITKQLRMRASGSGSLAEFVQNIKNCGSASIRFAEVEFGRHDPDASFKHLKAQYPGVVIEVSFSQKRRDLQRLADDYILGSDGNIRLVVGIDVGYRSKCATVSTWRPGFQVNDAGEKELVAKKTLSNQEFRDAGGDPTGHERAGLRIRLEDFAPQLLVPEQIISDSGLFISFARLCEYLRDAELSESTSRPNSGVSQALPPGTRKRRRSSTPSGELNTDDELQFKENEERDAKRSQRSDSSYPAG